MNRKKRLRLCPYFLQGSNDGHNQWFYRKQSNFLKYYGSEYFDGELDSHTTENEDHLEADLNQELTTESPFEEISDQQ